MAQLNFIVGDVRGNLEKIIHIANKMYQADVQVLVLPEMALSGYPIEDLTSCQDLFDELEFALQKLINLSSTWRGLLLVIGHPELRRWTTEQSIHVGHNIVDRNSFFPLYGDVFNTLSLIADGRLVGKYDKRILPNHGVFDEKRYFSPGADHLIFDWHGLKYGFLICEDIWDDTCTKSAVVDVEFLIVINASPFESGKLDKRMMLLSQRARHYQVPIVYVNLVGGQDELVFDGGSMFFDDQGKLQYCAPCFQENLTLLRCQITENVIGKKSLLSCDVSSISEEIAISSIVSENIKKLKEYTPEAMIYKALMLGLSSYVLKNNFQSVVLGLSGGIDSALVATLAVDALGKDNVSAVMMPSCYTSNVSLEDALFLSTTLGIRYQVLSIDPLLKLFLDVLDPFFIANGNKKIAAGDCVEENLQARIRSVILMAIANRYRSMVLATGNKSELATGYCTLYGDMAGAFAPIKDINKSMVYKLCRYRNKSNLDPLSPFSERILTREPSAELKLNQRDQDFLPLYSILDQILDCFIVKNHSWNEIKLMGFDLTTIKKVKQLITLSEYKRRQAPIGTKISQRAFGRDWRFPITSKF